MVADPWSGNRRESNRDNVLDRKPDSLFRGVKVSSAIEKDTDLGLFVTGILYIQYHRLLLLRIINSYPNILDPSYCITPPVHISLVVPCPRDHVQRCSPLSHTPCSLSKV